MIFDEYSEDLQYKTTLSKNCREYKHSFHWYSLWTTLRAKS